MELVNYLDISTEQLDARGKELSASLREIQHTTERRDQIHHELGNIAFELWSRYEVGDIEVIAV